MRAIRDVTVGKVMSKSVVVTPDTTIEALARLMSAHDFNAYS
jgi:CBS domain-containing protein